MQLKNGDEIQILADYYTLEGDYQDSHPIGKPFGYHGTLTVSYEDVGDMNCLVYYCLTDVFQNRYWTEALESMVE